MQENRKRKNIGIVWGYLPNKDEEALVAKETGLHQRVSLALNRYPDDAPGLFEIVFDKEFIKQLLTPLLDYIQHDTVEACDYNYNIHSTLDDAIGIDQESKEEITFEWIKLYSNNKIVCYIEHEAYESIGGPHPYHDAFVYAVYLKKIDRRALQQIFFATVLEHDILVTEIISGSQAPLKTKQSWLKKVLTLLKMGK